MNLTENICILLHSHLTEIKELNTPQLHKFICTNLIEISLGHFLQYSRQKTLFLFLRKNTNYKPKRVPNWISEELLTELIYDGAISLEELRYSLRSIEYEWGGNSNWGSKSKVVDLLRSSELEFTECKKKVHSHLGLQIENKRFISRNEEMAIIINNLNSLGICKHRDLFNILNACQHLTPSRGVQWNESSFSRFLERNNIKIKDHNKTFVIAKPLSEFTSEPKYLKSILKVLKTLDPEVVFRPKKVDTLILGVLKPNRRTPYSFAQYLRQHTPAYYDEIQRVVGGGSITAKIKYPDSRNTLIEYLEAVIKHLDNDDE